MPSSAKSVNLSQQVFKGISWSYASAILSGLLHLVSLSLLAHLLPPSEFGILGMALIFVSFAERIGQIGVGPAIVQKKEITDRQMSIGATTGIISGLLMYAAFYFLSPLAADFFREPQLTQILRILAVVFLVEGIGMVSDSRMQRKLRFKALMLADNLSYFLGGCVIAATLAYLGYGVWSLVFGMLTTRIIKVVIMIILEPQAFCLKFSVKEATPLLQFGIGFSLGRLLNFSALYGDNFVVGRLLGSDALGLYSRAYQLMTLPTTYFAQIIDRVMFPALSKKQDSLPHLQKAYFLSVDAVSIVSLPLSVVMYIGAREIILVVMGSQWKDMIPVLSILSTGIFFRTGYKSGDTLTRALGAVYMHANRQVIYTLAVIIGSVIGAKYAGLQGVAFAVLFAVALNYILMTQLSLKFLDKTWMDILRSIIPGLWLSVWVAAALLPLRYLLDHVHYNSIAELMTIFVTSGLAVIVAISIAPRSFRSEALSWFASKIKLGKFGWIGRRIEQAVIISERQVE